MLRRRRLAAGGWLICLYQLRSFAQLELSWRRRRRNFAFSLFRLGCGGDYSAGPTDSAGGTPFEPAGPEESHSLPGEHFSRTQRRGTSSPHGLGGRYALRARGGVRRADTRAVRRGGTVGGARPGRENFAKFLVLRRFSFVKRKFCDQFTLSRLQEFFRARPAPNRSQSRRVARKESRGERHTYGKQSVGPAGAAGSMPVTPGGPDGGDIKGGRKSGTVRTNSDPVGRGGRVRPSRPVGSLGGFFFFFMRRRRRQFNSN